MRDGSQFVKPPAKSHSQLGPQEFALMFRGRRLAIKAALLNQTLLSGVGNIYADESLFRAGIRPRRQAGRLTKAHLERLRTELVVVLEQAIRLGGSSVSDYVDAEGVRGFFQLEHCVYQRAGQPCLRCGTAIRKVIVGGVRITVRSARARLFYGFQYLGINSNSKIEKRACFAQAKCLKTSMQGTACRLLYRGCQ